MKKFAALAALGVLATACSHGGAALPPAGPAGLAPGSSGAPSTMGARTLRPKSITAPAGWAATATGALALANASDLGQLDRGKTVEVTLALQMRNADAVKSAIASGQRMSRDAFVAQYAPSSSQVSAAVGYLQSQGFSNVQAAPNNMLVTASAGAATVEKAFNTSLHAFSVNGKSYFSNTQPAYVPTSLGGNVVAVLGLTNFPGLQVHPTTRPISGAQPSVFDGNGNPQTTACTKNVNTTTGTPVCPRFYDPAAFSIAYDVAGTPPATNTQLAIFTEGDVGTAISDFRSNETNFGMPYVGINVLHVGTPSADTSGNTEWTLDMTYSSGMAYNLSQIDLYNAPSLSFTDLVRAINRWASDDIAPVMNASVGGCEVFPYESGDMLAGDMVLVEAAAQGQTLFASTGDTGAYCGAAGVPPNGGVGGAPLIEWPAASPYAVAVGGTDLFSNVDGTYLGEDAWQSGGGGLSQFEYSPYWESPAQPVGTTPAGLTFRGAPDIAYDAGIETGALLWQGGTEYITGGTSLASPMAAGVYARMQSAHGNALGFAAPLLYRVFGNSTPQQIAGPPETELIGPFHDILQGTNGLYTALPKYDYTTGLGSIDVARLSAALH
ncbi:MAG: S8/S53 family peptidase [Candidatus Eremiobacteraeota bacterium]|nr:S8/S53 family peptidase [Candidatus Eremiobacteraeota bacterium]